MAAADLPLSGITVLEFCHTIMGPTCGLVLADLGANVIKVEPTDGDRTRRLPGFASGFFAAFNRNKRSLAIDMKSDEGRRVVHRLVEKADVVVENFAVGTMEKLGCDYETLAKLNPGLIYCALKGFLSGPYEHRPALDEVVQFMAGLAYMTGPPGRPLRAGASVVDIMGGTFGVVGILAALEERHRTGKGKLVKSALFESTAFLVAQHMAGEVAAGEPVPPMPARRGAWGVYETFATADDEMVFVGITSNNHWQRFCEAFGRQDLLADEALRTNEQRVEARPRLLPIVADIVRQHALQDIMARLDELDIPYSPVSRPGDLFDDPHLNHAGRMHRTRITGERYANLPGIPLELGGEHMPLRAQPPEVGEHTAEILRSAGLADDEIASLAARGVIGR